MGGGAELYAAFPYPYFLRTLYTYGTGQPYIQTIPFSS